MKVFIFCLIIVYGSFGFSQNDSRGSKPSEIENPMGEKLALIVGVSNYLENSLKLNYADNDAALFKNYLNLIEGVPNENIRLLLNENAAALGIVSALKKLYNNSNSGDHLYIYFAGHGDVVDDFGEQQGFLLAADANASQEYYSGGVLSLKLLNTIINKLSENQVKVTLILDACRSGFLFEEGTHKNMGTIQAMFENSTKILSCGSNELSYESGELNHGYFTNFLVKGLSGEADTNTDSSIIYRELDDYLYNNVNNLVSKKLNQSQTPVIRTKNDRAQFKALKKENKIAFERLSGEVKSTKKVAARGIDSDLKKKDYDAIILDFKKAIQNQLYFGKSTAAYEIYKMASKKADLPKSYLDKMESTLLTKLSYEAQTLINAYINGSNALPSTREFNKQSKHLEICLELMGKDSFLYNRILASKLLLESYSTIKSKNYQKLRSAKSKLQTALKLEPRAAYIHNTLGDIYSMEKLYDSAFYQYNKAKKLIGSWSKPDKSLSDNFLKQYKYEEAKQLITNNLGTEVFDANLKLGEINTKQGKYALAENYYKSALKLQPNNARVLKSLSELENLKGNSQAAMELYNKALKMDSLNSVTNSGLLEFINVNDFNKKQSENLLLNAIDENPKSALAYSEYADFIREFYQNRKRLDLADSLYNNAINLNPYFIEAYFGKALLLKKLNDIRASIEVMLKAVSINPENARANFYLAEILKYHPREQKNTETFLLKAIQLDPFLIKAYEALVGFYNHNNQHEKSISLLKKMVNDNNNIPDFQNLLGQTYFEKGEYSKAIDAYKNAISIDSSYVKSSKNLGYSQLEVNEFEQARKNLKTSSNSDAFGKRQAEISEHLMAMAKTKMKFGTPDDVKSLYSIAFEINPSFKTGFEYAKILYLYEETDKSIEIAESLADKITTKKEKIEVVELLVKATIDANDKTKCDAYFNGLINLQTSKQDYLLAAVYFKFIGEFTKADNFKQRVNPQMLSSMKLKQLYSENAIEKYILEF